jgi:hypothetical protein
MCRQRIAVRYDEDIFVQRLNPRAPAPRRNIMADSDSGMLSFNTDALPERDRFPAFCEEMFRRLIGSDSSIAQ